MDTAQQDDREVAPPPARAPRRSLRLPRNFAARYAIIGVWIAMAAVYTAKEGRLFFSWGIFHTIFSQQESLVFMTMALLCTICVGEFVDLSVPAVFGFAATILPVLVVFHGWNVWLAAVIAVLGGVAVGAVNGYLVVVVGVNTIVVTLGMATFLEGMSLLISSDNTISGLPAGFQKLATINVFGLPIAFYYGVILVLGFAYLLAFTPLGRHMRFVGASREVSRLSGVRVNRIRFGSFVFAGLLAAVGAVITVAHVGSYTASTSDSNLLPVFASVFLGTAVIETGRFNAIGTWIAIYFLQTGITGLQLLNGAVWISPVFYGGVLVIAVTVSTILHRRSS
jgi:ribose transport system permease protein